MAAVDAAQADLTRSDLGRVAEPFVPGYAIGWVDGEDFQLAAGEAEKRREMVRVVGRGERDWTEEDGVHDIRRNTWHVRRARARARESRHHGAGHRQEQEMRDDRQ